MPSYLNLLLNWKSPKLACEVKGKPLSIQQIFRLSKLKAFAEGQNNASQKLKFVLRWVENIVEKRENAGYQCFPLFSQCFLKRLLFQGR